MLRHSERLPHAFTGKQDVTRKRELARRTHDSEPSLTDSLTVEGRGASLSRFFLGQSFARRVVVVLKKGEDVARTNTRFCCLSIRIYRACREVISVSCYASIRVNVHLDGGEA